MRHMFKVISSNRPEIEILYNATKYLKMSSDRKNYCSLLAKWGGVAELNLDVKILTRTRK